MSALIRSTDKSVRVAAFHAFLTGLVAVFCLFVSGCGVEPQTAAGGRGLALQGSVHGGQQPVGGALLQLYAVGTTGDGSAATPMLTTRVTTSDGTNNPANANANLGNGFNSLPVGAFSITGDYTCPTPSTQVYLVATGGNPGLGAGQVNPALAMLSVLGSCGNLSASTTVQINELTAVGSLAPLAPYANGYASLGSGTSDASQFLTALNLVQSYTDTSRGTAPGPGLAPGFYASTTEIATLADILAACINSDGTGVCQQLFMLTTPPGGTAPTDTIGAALNILKYPTNNTAAIFALLPPNSPFQPTLTTAPAAWTLPILPYAATPSISPAGGSYTTSPPITITTSTPNAAIYYTTDGSTPSTASTLYSSPFTLTGSATVKAIAVAAGYAASAAASATYTLPATGVATHIVFLAQPGDTAVSYTIPSLMVALVDAYGNQVGTSGISATVALASNPGNATLGGTKTTTSVKDGTFSFPTLTLSAAGVGYTLTVTAAGFPPITSDPFTVFPYKIAITQPQQVIGVGKSTTGTVTLGGAAPAGGVTVSLVIKDTSVVTVSPATVFIAAGATTATYTITGVAVGGTLLTASAPNYASGTLTEYASASYVSLGTPTAFGPVTSGTIPITLTAPAPTGGLTVTLTSSDSTVFTVSPTSVTFAAGATTTTSTVTLTGKGYGSATLNASPSNASFGGDARTISTGTLTATLTPTLTAADGVGTVTDTLTISSPAPGTGLNFTITTDNNLVGYAFTTVSIPAGATSTTFSITAYGVGSTTIHAKYNGVADATTALTVQGTGGIAININSGVNVQVQQAVGLTKRAGVASYITLTSSDPTIFLLSKDTFTPGTSSITFNLAAGATTVPNFYIQGKSAGTANIVESSDIYTGGAVALNVLSSVGVVFTTTSYSTNTATATLPLTVSLGVNLPNTTFGGAFSNPGTALTFTPVSSNTAVGTVTPTTFAPGVNTATVNFTPVGAGTTTITASAGAGIPQPNATQTVVTVTSPTFLPANSSDYGGAGVYFLKTATLSTSLTTGAPVTVTIGNPALAALSTSATVMGSSSVTFTGVTYTIPTVYVQGLAAGSTTITYSSPGFQSVTTTLKVYPAGFAFTYANNAISTTTISPVSTIGATLYLLTDTLNKYVDCISYCYVNPNGSVTVPLSSTNSATGTFTPLTFTQGSNSASTTFTPGSVGTATVTIGTEPAPYSLINASTGYATLGVTVTAGTFSFGAPTTAVDLYSTNTPTLSRTPANPITLTLTSSNPSVAVVSKTATVAGSASITYSSFQAGAFTYYLQGLQPGTTTLTLTGTGLTDATAVATVSASGIVFTNSGSGAFTTTFNSNSTTLNLAVAVLSGTGAVQSYCTATTCFPNPGVSFSIPVTSSNTNVGTIGSSPVVFAAGAVTASTTFTPNDLGATTVALGTQPSGMSASNTAGATQTTVTVTGDALSVPNVSLGSTTYTVEAISLPTTPARPVTVTVTLADPSLAKLSLDPAVMGTASTYTFTNVTAASAYATSGGTPLFYIQGVAPGYTKLIVTARGYLPYTTNVIINKVGLNFYTISTPFVSDSVPTNGSSQAAALLSFLDPYSQSIVSDCTAGSGCNLNPGVSPTFSATTEDATVGVFGVQTKAYDPSIGFAYLPYTALRNGLTRFSLGTQSSGFYNTSTASRNGGIAAGVARNDITYALDLLSHDIDAGVGIEVGGNVSLSGTTTNINTLQIVCTIADPTIAVLSTSPTVAGGTTISLAGINYINNDFYVQGLKAGTTTLTFTASMYQSRTITITVRPAGFVTKTFDLYTRVGNNTSLTVTPAVLNAAGQWMANAQMNPQGSTITVPVTSSNTAAGTVLTSTVSFAPSSTSGTVTFHPVASGTTTVALGAPSATLTQPTTYQSLVATVP